MLTLLTALAAATLTAEVEPAPTRRFSANGRTFVGRPREVCAVEGTWDDGEVFYFEAWDVCAKIRMEYVPPQQSDRLEQQIFGIDEDFIVPAGHEGYIISNEQSAAMLFRDRAGRLKQILISD